MIRTASQSSNVDAATVAGFGDEWSRFDQSDLSFEASTRIFEDYFGIFPWHVLPNNAVGADIGCGSGRWARHVAPKVGTLYAVDASPDALAVATRNLAAHENAIPTLASVDAMPFDDASLDFAYSLGVLHHVPDTQAALVSLAQKLKPGAPFLVYLYYAFDNRGAAFKALWWISNLMRTGISRLPHGVRFVVSQIIAALVYWPLAKTARILDRIGFLPEAWPLAYYRDKPFYVMRTDALDRFGTQLEHRFTKAEIEMMLRTAGFENIAFSAGPPYWIAVGTRR